LLTRVFLAVSFTLLVISTSLENVDNPEDAHNAPSSIAVVALPDQDEELAWAVEMIYQALRIDDGEFRLKL
jgi:hypothetical protein